MRIMAVILGIMTVICSGVGARDTRVSKNVYSDIKEGEHQGAGTGRATFRGLTSITTTIYP